MKRLIIRIVLFAAVLAGAALYWLFYDNRQPETGKFPLDIVVLRQEARRIPGEGPTQIEVESIYRSEVPRIAMIAGTDWGHLELVRDSFRLVYPNRSIIIDTASDEATARHDRWMTRYDRSAWSRMQRALSEATTILVTHEHCDHIGGLLQSPNWKQLLPKAILNEAQFSNVPDCTVWPQGSRRGFRPLSFGDIRAVAPGVVLIRAPGHTPGSQMIYVRRADGHEFLFMGDTASSIDNVRLLRPRSRYVMLTGGHQDDRTAVFLQTAALKRLSEQVPALTLVPGHDAEALNAIEKAGLLKRGFD